MRDITAAATGTLIAAALAGATMAGGIAGNAHRISDEATRTTPPATADAPVPAPAGWRTEAYRTVTFQVPDSWVNSGPTACRGMTIPGVPTPATPRVERPGPVIAIGCAETATKVDTVAGGGSFVTIDSPEAAEAVDATPSSPRLSGDRAMFQVDGIGFTVQAEKPLRDAILASFDGTSGTASGCDPTIAPVGDERPATPQQPGDIGAVESATACYYRAGTPTLRMPCSIVACPTHTPSITDPQQRDLFSARRLSAAEGSRLVSRLRRVDESPDAAECAMGVADPFQEFVVVHLHGRNGTSDIFIRPGSCSGAMVNAHSQRFTLDPADVTPLIAASDGVWITTSRTRTRPESVATTFPSAFDGPSETGPTASSTQDPAPVKERSASDTASPAPH